MLWNIDSSDPIAVWYLQSKTNASQHYDPVTIQYIINDEFVNDSASNFKLYYSC
mgnify:CR=1 FL=1